MNCRLAAAAVAPIVRDMTRTQNTELRRGWTTGACATAATKAALTRLWGGAFPDMVSITLPRGETPDFELAYIDAGDDWAEVGIIKDAGDDPDVTHGALIRARVSVSDGGIVFRAGDGVGTVTKAGLPIDVGEPAINPKPREMMTAIVTEMAARYDRSPDVEICITIPNGAALAEKTWNPRLGILGGLSVLGTTGVVRPFSCSAWIASIHRGVDVARATGTKHVAGCTGATSETVVQGLYDLPDHAMLDMGDFAGGMLKYLRKNSVERVTVGGGIGKMTKLAQGAVDLHSGRSQVDLDALAQVLNRPEVAGANTALEAYTMVGQNMVDWVAEGCVAHINKVLQDIDIKVDVVIIDRKGSIVSRAEG